ncbi:MAG TPA: glycosyltransferase family 2 protein [Lentimicrobium sp.]|jgi:glycosyltransferase involved in cell wall biosynthesis|nr:glycosyltransferase family 2 protein [Lentimicrobium sp.]
MSKEASVIIPAFNEETGIGPLLQKMQETGLLEKYEVIVVDDGSTDNTTSVITQYPVKLIRHGVNKGYGASLKTGIRRSTCSKVMMLDSDGQHDPAYLDTICKMLDDVEMVIGERNADSFQVSNRKGGKWVIRKTGEFLVDQPLPDFNSGLRGFKRELIVNFLHLMPNGFSFSTTSTLAFLKEGYTIGTFPIYVSERVGRNSSVKFFKDGSKTLLLIFRIIMLFNPLKVFFPASIIIAVMGVCFGIIGYLVYFRIPNSSIIMLTLGMFLFFFGLLADQIALLNRKKG